MTNTTASNASLSNTSGAEQGRRSRVVLLALLAVTGLPFLLALAFFYNPQWLQGIGTNNHGELVQPTRSIPPLRLQTHDGRRFDTASMHGNWSLLMLAGSDCAADCTRNLYHLRQIRLAMGEDRYRVLRLMLLTDGRGGDGLETVLEPFAGTRVLTGPTADRTQLIDLLAVNGPPANGRVYLVDPEGRLVLSYPPNPPWKDVLKDLQRLLKVVQL